MRLPALQVIAYSLAFQFLLLRLSEINSVDFQSPRPAGTGDCANNLLFLAPSLFVRISYSGNKYL